MTVRETKKLEVFPKILSNYHTKINTPLQHILTISSLSLTPKTKKITLTLTFTILTHIWKTRKNYKLQFDDTVIPATNVIINILTLLY